MKIGRRVRQMLGPLEVPACSLYRSMFLNVNSFGDAISRVPFGPRVLEIGTGDGMVAAQIVSRRTDTTVFGIDLSTDLGTLFSGDRSRVSFRTISTANLLAENPKPFHAVVIADVLHHVPVDARSDLLTDVNSLLASDGVLIVKESVVMNSLGFRMNHLSDYWITGDRHVSYMREAELRRLVLDNVEGLELCGRVTIKPWKMNLMLVWRRTPGE